MWFSSQRMWFDRLPDEWSPTPRTQRLYLPAHDSLPIGTKKETGCNYATDE